MNRCRAVLGSCVKRALELKSLKLRIAFESCRSAATSRDESIVASTPPYLPGDSHYLSFFFYFFTLLGILLTCLNPPATVLESRSTGRPTVRLSMMTFWKRNVFFSDSVTHKSTGRFSSPIPRPEADRHRTATFNYNSRALR